MKAVQVTAPGVAEYTDVPDVRGGSDALIKVHRVGICGTDIKILSGGIPAPYPITMGHEMIGEVVDPGSVPDVEVGTRVLVDPAIACGYCDLCRLGRMNICTNGGLLGRDMDGVFSEYVTAPASRILTVPTHISDKGSGVLQVLGTCIHAARATPVFPGDVAAVVGLGVSGLLFVQLLKSMGAIVVGITRSGWKRELAEQLGADATAAPGRAADLVADVTAGKGADVVVEAAGKERTLVQAIELTKTGGSVTLFGTLTGGDEGLPYYQLYHKELTIRNPRAALTADYQRGIALAAAGVVQLDPIVTHHLELADAAEAFAMVKEGSALKVLMEVG